MMPVPVGPGQLGKFKMMMVLVRVKLICLNTIFFCFAIVQVTVELHSFDQFVQLFFVTGTRPVTPVTK